MILSLGKTKFIREIKCKINLFLDIDSDTSEKGGDFFWDQDNTNSYKANDQFQVLKTYC